MQIGHVYMITSPTNRVYVGSSSNIEKRFSNYKCYDCKYQRKLYNSLKKYTWQLHKFEIVWSGPIEEMLKYETLIGFGFNVLEPENLNCKLPKIGENFSFVSEETKQRKSNSMKKMYSKMSIEKRNKLGWQRLGKKLSIKSIEKRSEKIKKSVIQLDVDNNFIKQWESASNASKSLNISQSDITQCCKQKQKTCGGFIWKYLNENFIAKTYKPRKPHFNKNKKIVIQMDLNNNFIKEWESIREACRKLNISGNHISSCCLGKRNKANGFKWKYKTNEDILNYK